MLQIRERIGKLIEYVGELRYPEEFSGFTFRMKRFNADFEEIKKQDTKDWELFSGHQQWGGHREYYWFETSVKIPDKFSGKCVLFTLNTGKEGEWDALNPQFAVYVNGELRQGFDVNHRELVLSKAAAGGQVYQIHLSAFTGDGNYHLALEARLKVLDLATEQYYYDLAVPYDTVKLLEPEDMNRIEILKCLNGSLNLLDLRCEYSSEYYSSLEAARTYLTKAFYETYCGNRESTVWCVGHTHIDVAWLWTLDVTRDKVVRSYATVLELMNRYPDYKFMASQPQLFEYVKQKAPDLFQKIKERIREGRFEAEGGMWLEADCNLTSGESLVRQFLHGKQFMKKEFGIENEVLWLPDAFGYSAALPQIMKKSGIRYFVTSKISWSEFNQIPFDTFMWKGIDGSEILTHFITTQDFSRDQYQSVEQKRQTTYVGDITPSHVKGCWMRYQQKYMNDEVLLSFGYGDGGGGPTSEMLEYEKRMRKGIPGCPKTVNGTLAEFLKRLKQRVEGSKYLPYWVGELYLEYHRGTYTSMARNKKYNRRMESAYQNAEFYAVLDSVLLDASYPEETLHKAWEVILRNQFHDILPGSCIKEVYDDSRREYEEIAKWNEELLQASLTHITEQISAPEGALTVFNPNGFCCDDIVELDIRRESGSISIYDGDRSCRVQRTANGRIIFKADRVPPKGYKTYSVVRDSTDKNQREPGITVTEKYLENRYYKIELDENGQITRFYDKEADREIIQTGERGNVIMCYEDRPHNFDAWDLAVYYQEKCWEISQTDSIEVMEAGPVRGVIKITRSYLNSRIEQYLTIYSEIPRVDLRNCVDWKEKQLFLKLYFPVNVHAEEATYDIQFGNIRRPTHKNTLWDAARFEVCAHKWIDLSEDGYGVSVLNDCKYGYSIEGNVIGLSMLKSGIYPNPEADKEYHEFSYSIVPHKGGWREADIVSRSYSFNNAMKGVFKKNKGGSLKKECSFVEADCDNIMIETIKKAEDSGDVVLRLYEAYNRRNPFSLRFLRAIDSVSECDLMEHSVGAVEYRDNELYGFISPYEIKTYRIRLKPDNGKE